MELQEIIRQVNLLIKKVLDNELIEVDYDTVSFDIEEWDSLNHLQLLNAIEKHFSIYFLSSELGSFENVGKMCEDIQKKLKMNSSKI